ncbi:probable anion transporter 1, chloroplastic [Trichonephila inaurata madagascariensis]|uniref:Probable anion transporter 1, chloroplastic n=1 Tax=Trichonephila inaurata madagascariensis TaxID=2747483 RepID=A0A8X7C188_9ARAC|nr:probable anion transporter 1, chloroplastic [Trichonephila inaurata madagascariensis]
MSTTPVLYMREKPRRYYVPRRVIFVILGFFGMFNVHALRVNLSVAIVAMVNNTGTESGNTSHVEDSCPDLRNEDNGITIARQTKGLSYPAMNTMIGRWAPQLERSRISAAVYSGSAIGTVVSLTVSGWLCETDFLGGWPAVFYVFGFIGCIWWVFWIIFISETPEDHPSISEEEISLYYQTEDDRVAHMSIDVPWRKILTSVPMFGLLIGHVGSYFGITILMIEIPAYLNSVLHFSVQSAGLITGLPTILEAIGGMSSSFIADKLISSRMLTVTTVRKIFNSISMYGSSVFLLGITASGCMPTVIIALYALLMYVNGFKLSGFNVNHIDMCPPLAGILFGLTNGIASLTGVIAPTMVGAFTQSGNTRANWNQVFYVTAGVYFVAATVYNFLASAEPQKWNSNKESAKKGKAVDSMI